MALLSRPVLLRAVKNIATWGDTDVFPFPIENHILHDKADAIAEILEAIAADFENHVRQYPIHSYSTLAPVGYTGFRWATQIDPIWNAYLLGLVLSLAQDIEDSRLTESSERVFSYRFRNQGDSVFNLDGWRNFQEKTRKLAGQHGFVVSVDIADFYSRVYHHRLENSLKMLDSGATRTRQIMTILGKLSNGPSYGLPVGGPAARLLAELVLNRVDHLLASESSTKNFCRFADDYRFFVDDIQSAYQSIGFLSEKLLRNEGLSLQKSKTRIMSSSEYVSMLDPVQPPPGSAAKFLGLHVHYDPYSDTAAEDYDRLKEQIDQFDILELLRAELNKGRVHTALTKKLVNALQFMDPIPRQQASLSLIENMETLAPVTPQVMLAVRSTLEEIGDDQFTNQVHQQIRGIIQSSHYVSKIDLNLAYMIRVLATRYSLENEHTLIGLYQAPHGFTSTPSPIIQRDILLILARWRTGYWLSDQKNYVGTFHSWARRAFLIGSYSLGDEGRHWRDANKASLGPFDLIIRDWVAEKWQLANWTVPI